MRKTPRQDDLRPLYHIIWTAGVLFEKFPPFPTNFSREKQTSISAEGLSMDVCFLQIEELISAKNPPPFPALLSGSSPPPPEVPVPAALSRRSAPRRPGCFPPRPLWDAALREVKSGLPERLQEIRISRRRARQQIADIFERHSRGKDRRTARAIMSRPSFAGAAGA